MPPPPPPQRLWNSEPRCPQTNYINNNNYQRGSAPEKHNNGYAVWDNKKSRSRPNSRGNSPHRPQRINKVSYHISSTGSDQDEVIEENAIYQDDFQVYHSVAYKKKMKRLEKLKKSNTKNLASMKDVIATRFVLTKVTPEMTEDDVECYLLEHFDVINEVYVRKKNYEKTQPLLHFCIYN